jgi:hypothetical protein
VAVWLDQTRNKTVPFTELRRILNWVSRNLDALALGIILAIAAILRFYGLEDKSLWGDEIYSLLGAQSIMANPHAVLYFLIFHFWALVSNSVLWNRLLSAILGILSIISVYHLILAISSNKLAYFTAFLLSVNSFYLGYSQEIRFYTLFLLNSSVCFLFLFNFLRTKNKLNLAGWCLFSVLTILTHMCGFFVALISVLVWFLEDEAISAKAKSYFGGIFFLAGVIVVAILLLARKEVFELIYRLLGDSGATGELRGFVITNVAKVPIAFFLYLMGETTNPGNTLWIVFCGAILGFLFFRGFYQEIRKGRSVRMLVLTILPVLFLFSFLDMIVPKNFPGAEPKYVIFVLPFILFLVAEGCFFKKRAVTIISIFVVIILSTGNLFAYYSNTYNVNSSKLIDLKGLSAFVSKYRTVGAVYYSETPKENLKFFPWENGAKNFWDLVSGWEKKEKIVPEEYAGKKILIKINVVYRKDLNFLNSFIEALQKGYVLEDCFHSHGAQAFLFSPFDKDRYPVGNNGEVLFATQFYSLPYDALDVKSLVPERGRHFEMDAVNNEKSIELMQHEAAKVIEVHSQLMGRIAGVEAGEVGFLLVTDTRGHQRKFLFKKGLNTGDWKYNLRNKELSLTQFQKKIKLVGRSAYPDAYRGFDAKIHRAIFDLSGLDRLERLDFKFNSQRGTMVVWGIKLL